MISNSLCLSQSLSRSIPPCRSSSSCGIGKDVLWDSVVVDNVYVSGLVCIPAKLRHTRALGSYLVLFHGHLLLLLLKS
jgi:hypothetical protein